MEERETKGEKTGKRSLLKLALIILGVIIAIAISITISLKFPAIRSALASLNNEVNITAIHI